MAILTLKTKQEIENLNPAKKTKAILFFELIGWHKSESGYIAEFLYFYNETVKTTNEEGEETETVNKISITYLANIREVNNATVNAIASQVNSTATNYTARELEFLTAGCLSIIGQDGHFGLTAADWEVVNND